MNINKLLKGLVLFMLAWIIFEITHWTPDYTSLIRMVILLVSMGFVLLIIKKHRNMISKYDQMENEKDHYEKQLNEITHIQRENEMLFNSLAGVVFSYDINNNQTYFSEGCEEVFGYSQESFQTNQDLWRELIHSEDRRKIDEDNSLLLTGDSTKIEYRINHQDLGERWVVKFASPIIGVDGSVVKINGQIIDVTLRKELEKELNQMAYYDDLTDLPNRKSLDKHLTKTLARSKRHGHQCSIMFIDLDDFKTVNDTLGHDAGDDLLKEVVKRLNDSIREEDMIARLGGDEFIIVFEETSTEEIQDIGQRIIDSIAVPYSLNGEESKISLSIGISMFPDDGDDKETLIDHADKAMYYAKSKGKNNCKLYTSDLNDMNFNKIGLVERLLNKVQETKLFTK